MSFPDQSNTGVPLGVTLTPSGGFVINTPGVVISGLNITGSVVINAANVTLTNCKITGDITVNGESAILDHLDIIGHNWVNAVAIDGANTVVRFCDISSAENGIWLEADGVRIEENYIHNLFSNTGNPDPHIDGIQIPGKNVGAATIENVVIRHNNIDLNVETASSSITMADGVNVDIINNRLSGGSYVIYFEGASKDCDVVNNVFNKYGFGYVSGASEQNQTYSGNVDEMTGILLPFNADGAASVGHDPAFLVYQQMFGFPPTNSQLAGFHAFQQSQVNYALSIGVQDAKTYAFEAFGLAFAEGPVFKGQFGPGAIQNDATFATLAWQHIFNSAPSGALVQWVTEHVEFYETIYAASGAYGSDPNYIGLLARGATYGLIIGQAEQAGIAANSSAMPASVSLVGISEATIQY